MSEFLSMIWSHTIAVFFSIEMFLNAKSYRNLFGLYIIKQKEIFFVWNLMLVKCTAQYMIFHLAYIMGGGGDWRTAIA